MSVKVLTLFGEEIISEAVKPAPQKVAPKERVPKPKREDKEKAAPRPAKARKERELKRSDALNGFNGEKQYYSIGEVADLFKVRTSNIRFWTKEFNLKVRTTRKGDRLYTPEQVREINTIYHLVKERGFTITGAKAKLKDNKQVAIESVDLKKSLTQLRKKLVQIRNKLS